MKIGVTPVCFEKLEAKIQEIENIAIEGEFAPDGSIARFQRIVMELSRLRVILLENFFVVPDKPDPGAPRAA